MKKKDMTFRGVLSNNVVLDNNMFIIKSGNK